MELIISILCLLLGGAYCEDQGAGTGQAQPTAVATAGVTPQPTAIPTVPVDPYTPVDPNCNYDHYPTVLSSMAISPGGSKPRACWAAENYPRTYLAYLQGCPSCARNAFIRRYGHRPAEGNYLKHGEWVSRLEYYGTFVQMLARLDRYAADGGSVCGAAPAAVRQGPGAVGAVGGGWSVRTAGQGLRPHLPRQLDARHAGGVRDPAGKGAPDPPLGRLALLPP